MKHLRLITLIILLIGCNNNRTSKVNKQPEDKVFSSVSIDTVEVKDTALTNLCLLIEESNYPKISGTDNDTFEKQLNDIFSNNFNSFIDSSKSQLGSSIPPELRDVYTVASWSTSVGSSFEILTLNDNIISVVQYFSIKGGGGTNAWRCSSIVTNCHIVNKIILNCSDLKISFEDIGLINSRVKSYFDQLFSEEKMNDLITYPVIENKNEFDKLKFGIQNDSTVLVIEAMPTSHNSYETYIIPIDKWRRESNTTGFETDKKLNVTTEKELPVTKERELYPKIAGGCHTTILLRQDGKVLAWGRNSFGALGNGLESDSPAPVEVSGLTDVIAISAACEYNIALKSDGTVWSWGSNEYGGLGNGSKTNSKIPVQATGLKGVTAIAGGSDHTLALKSDGTVWTWGNNSFGQIGDGTKNNDLSKNDPGNDQLTPVRVSDLTGVWKIAASRGHSLALKTDGTLWAWGRNDLGQLGDGTDQERFTPVQVVGSEGIGFLTDITMIAAGGSYGGNSAAVRSDGTLFLWGDNNDGQLGDGSEKTRLLPGAVTGLTGVRAVAIGGQHVIALKLDGTVWAWGYNNDGQLGIMTDSKINTPVQVPGLSGIESISVGSAHNIAVSENGTVWVWGDDSYSQLGDGTIGKHLSLRR
jgi:alpha-tubulin suppressor-like RCC1 family protein